MTERCHKVGGRKAPHGTRTEPEGRSDWSVREPAIDWEAIKADPLAWIRELAFAHAEKLRDEAAETTVIVLDDYRRSS